MCLRRSKERLSVLGLLVASLAGAVLVLLSRVSAAPPATAYQLMDYESGIVVLERNGEERRYPASLTKMLTAVMLMESLPAGAKMKVSERAAKQSGALLGLKPGDTISREEALKAILLESDNDATVAAVETAAASVEDFLKAMNARAEKMGAKDTNFVNPTGIHDPRHFSTTHDMTLIAREALRNPEFASLVRLRTATVKWSSKPQGKTITNRNRMLFDFPGCEGVKTGTTPEAGDCLAAVATRNGWRLLVVVLGAKDALTEAKHLLDQGFAGYKRIQVLKEGKAQAQASVTGGRQATVAVAPQKSFWLVMPKSVNPRLGLRAETVALQAPVKPGQRAGQVTVLVHGKPRLTVPLLTTAAVEVSPWRAAGWLKAPGATVALFLLTYWALVYTRRRESAAQQ